MKPYYMCLVRLSKCLPLAGGRIPSQHPQGFYKLLLAGVATAPDMNAKQYTLQHNKFKPDRKQAIPLEAPPPGQNDPDECWPLPLGHVPPPPRPKTRSGGMRGHGGGGRGRGGAGGVGVPPPVCGPEPMTVCGAGGPQPPGSVGGEPPPLPPALVPGGGGVAPPPPGGDGPEEFFGGDVRPKPSRSRRFQEELPWVDGVEGCRVIFDPYVTPAGKPQPNWTIKCPHHVDCWKTQGVHPRSTGSFGAIGPPAFLHAWADISWPTEPKFLTHRQETPKPAAVQAYVEKYRVEFEALVTHFVSNK